MKLKTVYTLTISTLTPLHIGNGETLARDFDYAVHDKQTWVINEDAFASQMFSEGGNRYEQLAQAVPPGQLLQPQDFQPGSTLFRYVMRGAPLAAAAGSAIQAHIKDVMDMPYLPGSSLKGSLRTVLFRHFFTQSQSKLSPTTLRNSRSWAAQDLEHQLFGRDPNHDLLRALQVSDSAPISADHLVLLNAQVFNRAKGGAPIPLECIRSDAVFTSTLTIDDYLLADQAAQKALSITPTMREALTHLPRLANEQTSHRIQQELAFYASRPKSRVAGFYRQLAGLMNQIQGDRFLLQVGWGGGWDNKTLGYLVPDREREAIINQYRLAKGSRNPGDPFPKSRRAVAQGWGEEAQPVAPLGWLLVEMKEGK